MISALENTHGSEGTVTDLWKAGASFGTSAGNRGRRAIALVARKKSSQVVADAWGRTRTRIGNRPHEHFDRRKITDIPGYQLAAIVRRYRFGVAGLAGQIAL
jgi:hypothetical protein